MPSTPTVPPLPSVPILVLPMLTVWVVASSRVLGPATAGSTLASVITATLAVGIMKMLDSKPDGRNVFAPSIWPLPDCASAPSPPSAVALMMNCRSEPWHG